MLWHLTLVSTQSPTCLATAVDCSRQMQPLRTPESEEHTSTGTVAKIETEWERWGEMPDSWPYTCLSSCTLCSFLHFSNGDGSSPTASQEKVMAGTNCWAFDMDDGSNMDQTYPSRKIPHDGPASGRRPQPPVFNGSNGKPTEQLGWCDDKLCAIQEQIIQSALSKLTSVSKWSPSI